MSFDHVGHFSLARSKSTWVQIHHEGWGANYGAQWFMADPELYNDYYYPFHEAEFEVGNFRKKRTYNNDIGGDVTQYSVQVINVGPDDGFFTLQGGGNI
jgi:hypothetical protein